MSTKLPVTKIEPHPPPKSFHTKRGGLTWILSYQQKLNPLITFLRRMISILTTLSNFSCVISILTTLSEYTCIFESILQLLGKIFQTDTFKIFESIAVIFFGFLNVIVSKNQGIVFIAILQCLLNISIIFMYFISWWIRCASADGGDDYKSKELDILTTVS